MKECRVVPTPTGWRWARDNRPRSPSAASSPCVFSVAYDRAVPNHLTFWGGVLGREIGEMPNSVHRAILHIDRESGTDDDCRALGRWTRKALRVRVTTDGSLPSDVEFTPAFEDHMFPGP